jgi:chromosomal replication initiator protein
MTPADILATVAEEAYVTPLDLRSKRRAREYSYPRHLAIMLIRDRCGYSFPRIAALFGGRHLSTVIDGYRTAKQRAAEDPAYRDLCERVCERLAA